MGKDYFSGFKYALSILAAFTPLVREPVAGFVLVAAYVRTKNAFRNKENDLRVYLQTHSAYSDMHLGWSLLYLLTPDPQPVMSLAGIQTPRAKVLSWLTVTSEEMQHLCGGGKEALHYILGTVSKGCLISWFKSLR